MIWVLKILLVLYTLGLLSSIAAVELISVFLTLFVIFLGLKELILDKKKLNWRPDFFESSLLAFNGFIFLSLIFSPVDFDFKRLTLSLATMKISLWYFSLRFLLIRYIKPEDIKKWLWVWGGVIAICSLYTIFQFFTGIDIVRGGNKVLAYGAFYRPTGFFSMSLTLSYCLGMAVLTLMPILPHIKNLRKHILLTLVFVVGLTAVVLTLSRGAWLGLMIASFILWLSMKSRYISGLLAFCSLLLVMMITFNSSVQHKIFDIFDPSNSSNYFRLTLWQTYWSMFADHWLTGVGWELNEFLQDQYLNMLGYKDFTFRSHAHNNFLQVLSGTGLFGAISYAALSFAGLSKAYNLTSNGNKVWVIAGLGILASQLFFQVGGMTECNFTDDEVSHMLFSNWAVLSAIYYWKSK